MKKASILFFILVFTIVTVFGLIINAYALEKGDANADGKVNADDAIYLLYHVVFGKKDYPLREEGDYNSDGKVDKNDAIYLLYHTIFPNKYPLYPEKKPVQTGDNWSPDVI
ncbi:MAG: dockerin type I repeat-containing protein [Clostridia bacterium]|nr:dockerin type I repeat-containing protein [Clostridia bacterium]